MKEKVRPAKTFTLIQNNDHKFFGERSTWQKGFVKHPYYKYFTVSQLMSFHVHLGGNERDIIGTSYWFLYGRRRGFVFIDLHPTILALRRMTKLITSVIRYFGKFMFVNQDRLYCWGTQKLAIRIGEGYCIYSWVGGLLTNYKRIWAFYHSVLKNSDWSLLRRPKARLKFILQGLDALYGPPTLIFINCLKYASNVAAESHAVGIPAIGLVDLNSYSSDAYYLIPSNDDSTVTVGFFNDLIARLIMKTKLKRCFIFLQRKKFRETRGDVWFSMQYNRAIKVYNYFRFLERKHTINFKMPLKEWVALRQARSTLAGLGTSIPNFVDKHVTSFIYKRLKKEIVSHKSKLRNLRNMGIKASFVYKKYYLQFFQKPSFQVTEDNKNVYEKTLLKKDSVRFPVKVFLILKRLRWLFELKQKYEHLQDWLRWRIYKQWKESKLQNEKNLEGMLRLQSLLSFYSFWKEEVKNLRKLYKFYLYKYYKPLQQFFYTFSKRSGMDKKNLAEKVQDELFNEIYYGKSFYRRRIKFDDFSALQRALVKYDKMKKQQSLTPKSFGKPGLSFNKKDKMEKIDFLTASYNKNKNRFNKPRGKNFRKPWRMRNPYSWNFRRLWKPSKVVHFFYWNPYYLALLRNRPWLPRKIARYYLKQPRNVRHITFKNNMVANLIKNNLNFFLKDSSFSVGKDFVQYVEKLRQNPFRLLNQSKMTASDSVDFYLPIKPLDLISPGLHLFFNYWKFKIDSKLILSFFKNIKTMEKYYGTKSKFLEEFVNIAIASRNELNEIVQTKKENLIDKHKIYFADHRFWGFYSMVWGNETFIKTQTAFVNENYLQSRTDLISMLIQNARGRFDSIVNKFQSRNKIISYNMKKTIASNILAHRMDQVSWVWPYYELLSHNRVWFEKFLGLFEMNSFSFSTTNRLTEFSFIYRMLSKITHMQRLQTTTVFIDSFLSGQLKSNFHKAKIHSPLMKRLDRKLRQRRDRNKQHVAVQSNLVRSQTMSKYKSKKSYYVKRKFNRRSKFRKIRSPFYKLPREQRLRELRSLFPFHSWLMWYHGSRLTALYYKQLISSFVQQMWNILKMFDRKNLYAHNKVFLKNLLQLFETILTILVVKTGDVSYITLLNRVRKSNTKDNVMWDKTVFYFKWLLNFIRKVSAKRRTSRHSRKLSLTYLWRFFYKNTAKAYFMPARIMASKNVTLVDLYGKQSFFFNRDAFSLLKQDVFSKFGNFHGRKRLFASQEARHDDFAGIPTKPARVLLMKTRSKFVYNRFDKTFTLKTSERLKGRVLLQALFNDFQYGRIKSKKQYRIIREVIQRFYYINRQKHHVFVEMFQNNPFVDRPHLKADLDKYTGSHLFFLRNFGARRFIRKRRFDSDDVYYFIRWFLRHKRGVPSHLRKRFTFFLRMWHNDSMFLTY